MTEPQDSTPLNESENHAQPSPIPPSEPTPVNDPVIVPELADSAGPSMDEIDREVAAAMEGMDISDRAELGGGVVTSESVEPGTEMTGTVVGLTGDEIFIEFGVKSQGVMQRSDFGKKEPIEVGRRIDAVVDRFDEESSLLILYRKGAIQRASWANMHKGSIVEGRVTGLIKGGLEIDLQGIRAFLPGSQTSIGQLKDISVLLNEKIRCEVTEVDRRGKNVVVSRRKLLEKEQAEAAKQLKTELEVGQTRKGIVRNITEFGAFVDIGGIEGLVHISDLSWGTVDKVTDVVSMGQEIDVVVLKIDTKRDRLSLGLKQAQPNPWDKVPGSYPAGTSLKVRVVRIADFGVFAELEPGIEGLIPISEMGWTRLKSASDAVSVGDMVDAVVIRVEVAKQRLALSMKQATPDPWEGVLDGYEVHAIVKGRVTRLADFGVFVELVPGVEGLIHISELSDRRVRTCGEVVQEGQEIETRILGIDKETRRISLSIKQVAALGGAAAAVDPAEPPKPPKKRKKPLRGGLSSHYDW